MSIDEIDKRALGITNWDQQVWVKLTTLDYNTLVALARRGEAADADLGDWRQRCEAAEKEAVTWKRRAHEWGVCLRNIRLNVSEVAMDLYSPGGVGSPQTGENLEPGYEQAPPGAVGEAAPTPTAADASRENCGRPDIAETADDSVASPPTEAAPAATLRTAEEAARDMGVIEAAIRERDAEIVAWLRAEAKRHEKMATETSDWQSRINYECYATECRRLADLVEAKGAPTNQPTEARDQ